MMPTNPQEYLRTITSAEKMVLYYPGSGTDWGPFSLFANNAPVSTVIYSDYGSDRKKAETLISSLHRSGWNGGQLEELTPNDFGVSTWEEFWPDNEKSRKIAEPESAFAIQTHLSNSNGAKIRFIFLATEAIQTFSILVRAGITPTAIVLQDHGLGGGWAPFGGKSELWQAARELKALPELLFVANNTKPWSDYARVSDDAVYEGQMHDHRRALYRNKNC